MRTYTARRTVHESDDLLDAEEVVIYRDRIPAAGELYVA